MIHTVKGFGVVNKAEVDVFSGTLLFFDDPMDVGDLIFGSSALSKSTSFLEHLEVHSTCTVEAWPGEF